MRQQHPHPHGHPADGLGSGAGSEALTEEYVEEALEARDSAEPWTGREAEHTVSAGSGEGPGRQRGPWFCSASGAHGEAEPGAGVGGRRARAGCLVPRSAPAGSLAVRGAGLAEPERRVAPRCRPSLRGQEGLSAAERAARRPSCSERALLCPRLLFPAPAVPGPGARWVTRHPRAASSSGRPAPRPTPQT